MKNLGKYIIPQIFENYKLKYYHNDNIQNINADRIIKDLDKEIDNLSKKLKSFNNYIDYKDEQWRFRLEMKDGYKDLIWNKYGKYLGLF